MLSTVEIIKKYNLFTKKSFGQNFLVHPELMDKIVKCAGTIENHNVLEVGTGPAGLTTAILRQKPKKLITLDLDERCIAIANAEIRPFFPNLEALLADALEMQGQDLFKNENYHIIANLPYNVATPLLFKWLEGDEFKSITNMTLMFQKEVVDRMVAQPKTKDYGRLSVMCQYLCDVKKCFDIAPTAFLPPPKVISTVVSLTPKNDIDLDLIQRLSHICKQAFNQRRKTLANNLKGISIGQNFDSSRRAEELTVDEFVLLAKTINN